MWKWWHNPWTNEINITAFVPMIPFEVMHLINKTVDPRVLAVPADIN